MKSRIVLIIALVMIASTALSGVAFAKEDAGLEDAIKRVKQVFDIPEENSEFSYSASSQGDLMVWMLDWRAKGDEGSNVSIALDSTGDILRYYSYRNMDQDTSKLPKISRDEAKAKAEGIIEKINPQILGDLKLKEDTRNASIYDRTYHFEYIRTYNGIVFPSNRIAVEIDKQTGELTSYNKTWSRDVSFPTAEKILSLKEAQEAYIKNLGLRLTYNAVSEKDAIKVYAAYTPIYDSRYYIDALTGERFSQDLYIDMAFNESAKQMADRDVYMDQGSIALTPEEMEAVEEVSGLLAQKEAEKIARELKVLELDDEFLLEGASLSKSWPDRTNYHWNLYFVKTPDEDGKDYRDVNVGINAKTGEIVSFNTNHSYREEAAKFDREAAKKIVEEFLNEIQPEKFKETEYDEISDGEITYPEGELPTYQRFNYTRMVEGIPFSNNGIGVGFDAVTGKIQSYSLDWYDVEFPSIENAVELEKMYEIFFKEIGLELQYISAGNDIVYVKSPVEDADKKTEAKLVYAVNTNKPIRFDADTGAILNNDGKPYKEKKVLEYTDISDHYAKNQIEMLAQIGVGLEGPELKPDEKIKQKDFLLLISQVLNGYEFYGKNTLSSDEETENLYKMLMRQGIIKEDEKNPEDYLTREDSVKFAIRALNYGKLAELSDIFNCTFKDKDEINPELVGHVVIAKGLKIVNGYGEYFRPKEELKRADALIIIYNYLQV